MSTELQLHETTVIDRLSGEVIAVAEASTEQLAEFVTNQRQVRDQLSDAEAAVSAELVSRLDRSACWTLRVGDPEVAQWEITAPSPTAGTETYPPDLLVAELAKLIAAGTITTGAASKACKRQLVLTLEVPWSAEPQELADALKDSETVIEIAGVRVKTLGAEPVVKTVTAGINALRKVPGTEDALDAARMMVAQGARRVKVTRKAREL